MDATPHLDHCPASLLISDLPAAHGPAPGGMAAQVHSLSLCGDPSLPHGSGKDAAPQLFPIWADAAAG